MFKLKKIRGFRKLKRMSQEDLAWKIGFSAAMISRIELGDYDDSIKLITLEKIAKALDVSMLDLIEIC